MDKKAFFTDPIIAVFSFIALVLIFIIFNLVFAGLVDEREFDLNTVSKGYDSKIQLMQLMRMPIEYDGYKTDVAGMIMLAEDDPSKHRDIKNLLEEKMQEFLDTATLQGMFVRIQEYDGKLFFVQVGGQGTHMTATAGLKLSDQKDMAVVFIPSRTGTPLKVEGKMLR